jgi:putative glutamine amidotransferase
MMTPLVAVTQRVAIDPRHRERRDALDQRWTAFLSACGAAPLLVPNTPATAAQLLEQVPVQGLLLTGGNTLAAYGGDAPERDLTELQALAFARARRLPVVGICRGMQLLLHAFNVPLTALSGHAGTSHVVTGGRTVNSFHDFGAVDDAGPLRVTMRSHDAVVEAIAHPTEPICGVMWHPERCDTFDPQDVQLFREAFRLG